MTRLSGIGVAVVVWTTLCAAGFGGAANAQKASLEKSRSPIAHTKAKALSARSRKSTGNTTGWGLPTQNLPSDLNLLAIKEQKTTLASRSFLGDSSHSDTKYPRLLSVKKNSAKEQRDLMDRTSNGHLDTYLRKQFQFGSGYKTGTVAPPAAKR